MVGLIVAIGGRLGFDLDGEMILTILSPILAYIASQGLADALPGKEKVMMEAAARNFGQQPAQTMTTRPAPQPVPVSGNFQARPVGGVFPPNLARLLNDAGFLTVEDLRQADNEALYKAGLTPVHVEKIRAAIG